jgi:xylulokinase
MFALYKLRWMRKHRPDILEKTRKLCFIADYMTYRLGAAHKCDYSLAARSAMFNVFTKAGSSRPRVSTIDRAMLPEPVPSGIVVGGLSRPWPRSWACARALS